MQSVSDSDEWHEHSLWQTEPETERMKSASQNICSHYGQAFVSNSKLFLE